MERSGVFQTVCLPPECLSPLSLSLPLFSSLWRGGPFALFWTIDIYEYLNRFRPRKNEMVDFLPLLIKRDKY